MSQFTLYGDFQGNKLDLHRAMAPTEAKAFYDQFVANLRAEYKATLVQGKHLLSSSTLLFLACLSCLTSLEGEFGAMMEVSLVNDGPVTVQVDTKKEAQPAAQPQATNDKPKASPKPTKATNNKAVEAVDVKEPEQNPEEIS